MSKKINKYTLNSVTIEGFAAEGNSLLKYNDKVIFVPYVVPGDVADIEVYKQKKSYCYARVLDIKQYSDKRSEVKCPHFTYCGGCKWQMLDYKWQLYYKQQQVYDSLVRIGKVECDNMSDIIGSDNIFYYRNKLEFTFSDRAWVKDYSKDNAALPALGFHVSGLFDKVLNIDTCLLQQGISDRIRNFVRERTITHNIPYYNIKNHTGVMRTLVIRTTMQGEVMVLLAFAENNQDIIKKVMGEIRDEFPQITSLQYCINDKMNDSLSDREFHVFYGKDHITEYMPRYASTDQEPLKFKIRPKTFYQTNPPQALKLYTKAADFADISSEDTVYDLYTGTGTIANFIANKAKKVVGIEYVEDAVEDARINSVENGIDNTVFFAGDMAKVLTDEFVATNGRPDIIITDPPRNGMAESVVKQIMKIHPKKIVYISCNPATQARDLQMLQQDYKVNNVQPVDMFPHTHHIENIVSLTIK
ncbi:MAG: 23S rRNA (uracil(1939)-C(5))-methyltransferase RlmD [Bacteroidales bacterium]|nr:23S rRNA (uracil(1939)-C(5))-methyltransferase RlmD [Bacteroidales bacterium]